MIAQGLLRSGALDRLRELLASPRSRSPHQLVALLTLIGTSTNLLASDLAAGLGYGSFQLLSFTSSSAALISMCWRCIAAARSCNRPWPSSASSLPTGWCCAAGGLQPAGPALSTAFQCHGARRQANQHHPAHRKHLAVAVMVAVLLGVGVLVIGGLYSLSVALQQSGLAALVAVDGLTLITTVVFAASQSFSSPIVYQTNLMVFAPGRYCLLDELRYGWPLSLLDAVTVTAFVLWLG